jgi:hypothetical protein
MEMGGVPDQQLGFRLMKPVQGYATATGRRCCKLLPVAVRNNMRYALQSHRVCRKAHRTT